LSIKKPYKIIIAGGGTGGHVFPAIAIANRLKEVAEDSDILFVGAKGKLEMVKVVEAGYNIVGLPISGFHRSFTLRNLSFPFKLLYSLIKSIGIVMRFKPDIAVGVGGFASGPVLFIASLFGIPTLIQEQNSYPGVTNKLLAKRAKKICVSYDGLDRFFDPERIVKTGNPVRKAIMEASMEQEKAKAHMGFDPSKQLILAIGGSLGARTLNDSLFKGLDALHDHKFQLMWQCGKLYFDEFYGKINQANHPNIQLVEFIKRMDIAYAAADIIVSRAGALSISELCLIGKPVILVPSPNVSEDHQTKNAMALVEKQAAIMVADKDAGDNLVGETLRIMGDAEKMRSLGANVKALAYPTATELIVNEIIGLIR